MGCYFGCGTRKNVCCYVLYFALLVVGGALLGAGLGVGMPCDDDFGDCTAKCTIGGILTLDDAVQVEYSYRGKTFLCSGLTCCNKCEDDVNKCHATWLGLMIVGLIVLAFASCPCYYFCCCATDPRKGQTVVVVTGGVPMAAVPIGTAVQAPAKY